MSLEHTKQVPGCVHFGFRCGTIQRPRLRAKCFPFSLQQTMLHHHQPFLVASSEDTTIIGKSRSHLANMMRLLNLPQDVQTMITGGLLSAGQARPLIGHDDASSLAKDVAARNMSARQVESMVARLAQPKSSEAVEDDTDLKALEAELREKLGINVALRFNSSSQKGRITIDCTTLDQFDEMVGKLKKN